MAKITLKDKYGRVLAEVGEDDPVVATGETATVSTKPSKRVVATKTGETGYVEEEVLETWTESTVQIPESFAGLESLMVPTRLRDQLFDIISVDEQEEYVEITAVHMFYRQRQNNTLWNPDENTRYSGASACRNVLTNAMFDQGFVVASDSLELIDGNRLDYENKNIVEAFLDPENGICTKWDLSLIRDNDAFYCLKDVGYDRGFIIQNGKNLIGVERSENVEDTVTRVAPVARDENGDPIWMDYNGLKYVDSSHVSDYPYPKLEIYNTDLRIGENGVTEENVQAKLLEAAQKRFSEDEVDIPDITMTIRFISLGDTEEYAQYRNLDKVYLYDILHIKDTDRGYSYSAQVIGVEHNILTGILEAVTIGKLKKWDGIRKIGSWQVPEFSGGNIRPGSIRAGSFETAAIRDSDIANNAIKASHMSGSANSHFKEIFAEELYISNTSSDGLLQTRFTVTEGLIASEVLRASSAEGMLQSSIIQTASMIYSSVSANNSQIYSEVVQTASMIRSEVSNSLSNFYTMIMQTASEIVIRTGDATKTYHQPDPPVGTQDNPLVDGDLWFNAIGKFTWGDLDGEHWLDYPSDQWQSLNTTEISRYDGNTSRWVKVVDEKAVLQDTRFQLNKERINLVAGRVDYINDQMQSYRAEFNVAADEIRSTVAEQVHGLQSEIVQTEREIRATVADTNAGLHSELVQTAERIQTRVTNDVAGLSSSITQTASQIRTEVTDKTNQLSSSITQTANRVAIVVDDQGNLKTASIVAGINAQEGSYVKISADKISLSGYVTTSMLNSAFTSAQQISTQQMTISSYFTCLGYNTSWQSKNIRTVSLSSARPFMYGSTSGSGTITGSLVTDYSDSTIYYLGR